MAVFFLIAGLLPGGGWWVVPVLMTVLVAGFLLVGVAVGRLLEDR